jgi:hypothetical protein
MAHGVALVHFAGCALLCFGRWLRVLVHKRAIALFGGGCLFLTEGLISLGLHAAFKSKFGAAWKRRLLIVEMDSARHAEMNRRRNPPLASSPTRHRDLPVDGIAASPSRAAPRAIGLPQFRIGFSLCHPGTIRARTEAGNNNVPSTVRRDPGGQ